MSEINPNEFGYMTDTVTQADIISGRTNQVMAAEINMIKYQAERV
ncbi:hypothetical protein [Desulfosporosinus lacus]